ncbi:MAG: Npt1/Npt2 family nucleotide transporter [Polyangiaceae bacterium]
MLKAIVLAVFAGAMVIAQVIIGKTTRDTLFLSNFQANLLPTAVIVTALANLPAVLGGARAMARMGPQTFLRAFLLVNSAGFLLEWFALPQAPRLIAGVLYLHVGLAGGMCVSGFWSVVNERFDPHTARSVVARISTGTTVGGLLGGIVAERMATWFGVRSMLLTLSITNLVVAAAMFGVGSGAGHPERGSNETSGLTTLARSTYLQRLAWLMVLSALTASTLDFAFKSRVAEAFAQPERLAKFFAVYYMATSFVTVVVQATASRYSLERFGIGITLSVLPAVLLVGGVAYLSIGTVAAIVLLRGTEAVLSSSFFRSAYEPLYTPLPAHEKRSTKAIIDVAADRFGDAIGSVCILLMLAITPNRGWLATIGVAMVAAAACLWLASHVQRGYVAALADSLEQGMVRLSEHDVKDATTRLTLSQTNMGIDRVQVLRELASLRQGVVAEPELVRKVGELASGDEERILKSLDSGPLDRRLAGVVLPLLQFDALRAAVARALAPIAADVVGQLGDAIVDRRLQPQARHRVPAILATVHTTAAVRALSEGLLDADFELRQRCARGLLSLRLHDPALCPPDALVIAAVRRELEVSPVVWRSRAPAQTSDDVSLSQLGELGGDHSLQHVFTLLCLNFPPDVLGLALRALRSQDAKLRGTALEYLDNIIPAEIKPALWPHIAGSQPSGQKKRRTDRELKEELERSFIG